MTVSRPRMGPPKLENLYPTDRRRMSRRRGMSQASSERQSMLEKISKQKLVVIGNGMAGIRTVEALYAFGN